MQKMCDISKGKQIAEELRHPGSLLKTMVLSLPVLEMVCPGNFVEN